jgi:hypothetical protein
MKKVDSDFIFSRSLIFISLSFSLLFSQTSFTAEDIDKSHYGIDAVFAADMDNDGDMDIVTASYSDFTITWHENDGAADPTWTTVDIANDAEGAYCVFAADMDNDGDMDIVSASKRDNTIAWYENDGAANPTWTATDIATSANGAESVFAADMDNDGDMDILSASSNDGTIAWYENDGEADPTWTAADITTSADGANSVFAADMDNDGDMDIVSSSKNDDTIAWYENDGAADPSFTAADITTSADGANSVFVADMDNDGDMDIVSANHGPSFSGDDDAIAWYENDGAADPSWTAADITTNVMDWPRSVFVADFDNDGDMDIVSAFDDNTYNKLVWLENDGAADPSWMLAEISTNVGPEQVFAADMDNDGDMDILGVSYSAGAISWYENNLPPARTPTYTAAKIAIDADYAASVFAADMDGDGDMDIVSASYADDTIAWYENDGAENPTFTAADIATSANGAYSVFVADMDNDGDIDILSASIIDDAIAWYENDGAADPSWTAADIATSADGARSVFAADMDNDGDMDIVSASKEDDTIAWYENDGAANPSWTAADIATSADNVRSVFVADMDNDGDMDIVSASYNDDAIAWYENDGAANPSWTAADIATSADGAYSIFAADMDNDGDMDILSASYNDDAIAWYENDGAANPSWTAADITTSADGAHSVFAADMDHDGDMDIVSASAADNTIAWYENDGAANPSWTAADITTLAYGAESVFVADMDNDGDMDIVSASYNDDTIKWYEAIFNNTPAIAALSDITIEEDEATNVALSATDIDGDAITYSAVSDTNAVTVSVSSSTLTLTPTANWHGVATIKVSASDGKAMDSTSFKLTVTPVDDIAAVQDVTIDEDKSAEVTLTSTFSGTTTFTAVSDTNAVTTSVSSSTLTLTPTANWHGVANIKAYASDGTSKDSTTFKLTVTPVQDAPTSFEWVSSALDTINITQSNLTDTYTLQWDASTDAADGDSINYLVYAKIGVYPAEEVFDTTSTSVQITYQELVENVFEPFPMLPRVTVKITVVATDGIDTVNVTGDDRVLFVNRYEYLSTAGEGVPLEFALHENYPNPFNPTTTLRFDLPEVSNLTLTIYNMLGQKVKTFNMQSTPAGYHTITWDATNDFGQQVGAGVYLYQLHTKDFVKTRKMVLLK